MPLDERRKHLEKVNVYREFLERAILEESEPRVSDNMPESTSSTPVNASLSVVRRISPTPIATGPIGNDVARTLASTLTPSTHGVETGIVAVVEDASAASAP